MPNFLLKNLEIIIILFTFAADMKQTIDTYKLTSMEEPSDEILSQIMREAAEDARKTNEEATERYFNLMLIEARKVVATLDPPFTNPF